MPSPQAAKSVSKVSSKAKEKLTASFLFLDPCPARHTANRLRPGKPSQSALSGASSLSPNGGTK